ncbi:MAG: hypothetical protein AMS24_02890 [Chlamydiae bacterium SM23_39]|nr:MAG: hypothetical protein AMS24_02890 [Chlamydiae bacterium SM23_39]
MYPASFSREDCETYLKGLGKYLNYQEVKLNKDFSKTIFSMQLEIEKLLKFQKRKTGNDSIYKKYKVVMDNLYILSFRYESEGYDRVKGKKLIISICLPIILSLGGIFFAAFSFYYKVPISSIIGVGIIALGIILGIKLNLGYYFYRWYNKKTIKKTLTILQDKEYFKEWNKIFQIKEKEVIPSYFF